ncbi:helix-turn-helix domain-containing protein [Streptomyces sp. NRRL WC-3742]|uniref:helix-turn-helix domain-containing protein n=1 Tax=Streptomyces sp. NRRL WC-3742 TaxID=1463934 RepID=UPI0004CAB536|nr:helix-turn-helix transcriptional regulator [Streptomyces sp. NRRL WC-3742]
MAKVFDPTEAARKYYGEELRRLREAAGLTQEGLGKLVFCTGAYICQMEAAVRKPQKDMSGYLDKALDTDGHFQRLYEMVRKSSLYEDYFIDVVELQSMATTISEFSPLLVPGLLQTADYARALFESSKPLHSSAEIEQSVALRVGRSELLDRTKAPQYWAVLDEAVVRRPVGGAKVMCRQLRHLAKLIRDRKVIIQIVPFMEGAHALMNGSICLMTFDGAPPTAYIEGPNTGALVDEPALVAKCSLDYDLVRAAALSPEATLALVESAAEDYANAPRAVA